MNDPLIVYKGRTNIVSLSLGMDVSADTITSQIRELPEETSTLIATWNVSFATDGIDGNLFLTLDDTITEAITRVEGFMDVKRLTNGEPIAVFREPLQVIFRGSVTE